MREMVEVTVRVPVDEGVTADMIRNLLLNQLALNPVTDTEAGTIHWREVQIRVGG